MLEIVEIECRRFPGRIVPIKVSVPEKGRCLVIGCDLDGGHICYECQREVERKIDLRHGLKG
jgi:hypothetical protein